MSITKSPNAADIIDDVRAIGTHAIHTAETVRADDEQRILALEAECKKLAGDAAAEKTRGDRLLAANLRLAAEVRMYERISYELQDALDAKHLELRRVCEQFADLTTAYGQVETELCGTEQEIARLANQPKPWWRRNR